MISSLSFGDDVSLIPHVPWSFILLFSIWNNRYLLKSLLIVFWWHIFSRSSLYVVLSSVLYGYTCSILLALSFGIILKIIYLLWFLQLSRVATWRFFFLKGGATAQICGFFLAHRPWTVFWRDSLFTGACSCCYTWEQAQGASGRVGGCVGLALGILGMSISQIGGFLGEVLLVPHVWVSAGVLKAVNRNHIPLMSFDSLTCLFPDLTTPTPQVLKGLPQYSKYCRRETAFVSSFLNS